MLEAPIPRFAGQSTYVANYVVILRGVTKALTRFYDSGLELYLTPTFGENSVSWYGDGNADYGANTQFNSAGTAYQYLALG